MKEIEFLNIISKTLHDTSYIGDDCAYLKDLDIFVTHDTLVEDVHFLTDTTSPYQLGKKSAAVNLSDLAASASLPLYLTVSLSLAQNTNGEFVEKFYQGLNEVCEKYSVKVIGGDLTGSDKIVVSICAIGKKVSKYNVSRKFAKPGDIVITTGNHGDSAAGLRLLPETSVFSQKHLTPEPRVFEGLETGKSVCRNFAMMDSSDGLADALYKIAKNSDVSIEVDFEKIPHSDELIKQFPNDYKELMFWGGEDFELVACIPEQDYKKLDSEKFFLIGHVKEKIASSSVTVKNAGLDFCIDETVFSKKSFKHFGE